MEGIQLERKAVRVLLVRHLRLPRVVQRVLMEICVGIEIIDQGIAVDSRYLRREVCRALSSLD